MHRLKLGATGVIVVAIVYLVVAPLIQLAVRGQNKRLTTSRLEQIGVALDQYRVDYGSFPPAVVLGADGTPWHSWRVLLLPYLGQQALSRKYRMDEPWDGPANRKLIQQCPEVFQLPTSDVRDGRTNASVIVGRRTAWPAHYAMRAREFERGVGNTIFITETPAKNEWTNLRDLTAREFLRVFYSKSGRADRAVLLGDGSVRRLSQQVDRKLLLCFLTPRGPTLTFRGENWPAMFVESKYRSDGEVVSSSTLERSTFHASWDEPLGEDRNGLWCAVFQLAWDNLRSRAGGPISTVKQSPIVNLLNDSSFDKGSLDEACYSLIERPVDEHSTSLLSEEIRSTFPDVNPQLTDIDAPGTMRLYGMLKKSIFFPAELSPMEPLMFEVADGETLVESFGNVSADSSKKRLSFEDTVHVGDYISDDNFILVLRTEGGREDEVILAMVDHESTLRKCWRTVERRLDSPHEHRIAETLRPGELLQVPILDLNIDHRFVELENQIVTNMPGELTSTITVARETIKFRLDEVGADLLSQVEIVRVLGDFGGDGGAAFDPMKPRNFVFDRPFLLALREKSASQPYLLCWVAHHDIMVPANSLPVAGN